MKKKVMKNVFIYLNKKNNAILVDYPPKYYAYPKYITTNDLVRVFRRSDKTIDGFIREFKEYIEI